MVIFACNWLSMCYRFSFARSFSTAFTAHSKPTNVFQCSSIVFHMRLKTLLSVWGLTFGTHVQNNSIKYTKSNKTDRRDQEKRQVLVLNARILTDLEGHVFLGRQPLPPEAHA